MEFLKNFNLTLFGSLNYMKNLCSLFYIIHKLDVGYSINK